MIAPEVQPVNLMVTERWPWENKPLTALANNFIMGKLGEIARKAGGDRTDVGDSIDRGLILLRLLQEGGFELWLAEDKR